MSIWICNGTDYLNGLDLSANVDCHGVDLLIGQDFADALIPLDVRKGALSQPYVIRYKFGWTVCGKLYGTDVSHSTVVCSFVSTSIADCFTPSYACPIQDIDKLWEIDNEGFEKSSMTVLDKCVINLWDTRCKKINGHYELPISWKDPEESLPNNFVVADKRLHNLIGRLDQDSLYDIYDNTITKLLNSKYGMQSWFLLMKSMLLSISGIYLIMLFSIRISLISCMWYLTVLPGI